MSADLVSSTRAGTGSLEENVVTSPMLCRCITEIKKIGEKDTTERDILKSMGNITENSQQHIFQHIFHIQCILFRLRFQCVTVISRKKSLAHHPVSCAGLARGSLFHCYSVPRLEK